MNCKGGTSNGTPNNTSNEKLTSELNSKVLTYIVEHRPQWPLAFEQIRAYLAAFVPSCRIHHVGSTAVANMPAKDIIDIDIECPASTLKAVISRLDDAGYAHVGDQGIPTREAFKARPSHHREQLPAHHLYACASTSPELHRHLSFRDYLNQHHDRRDWLANEKRNADQTAHTRDEYISSKNASYQLIVAEALHWRERQP